MKAEALAPLFRICRDIPSGMFDDSYFVWLCQYFPEVDEQGKSFQRRELNLMPRKDLPKNIHEGSGCSIYPAPLIEEIWKEVMLEKNWDNIQSPNSIEDYLTDDGNYDKVEAMKQVHDFLISKQNNDNHFAIVDDILAEYLDFKRTLNHV